MSDTEWPNFWHYELACKHCGEMRMDEQFMDALQAMRTEAGFPFVLHSAYRCPWYNQQVSDSGLRGPHTTGKAVDVALASFRIYRFWQLAYKHGMTGHGHGEHKGFGHIDQCTVEDDVRFAVRPNGWTYRC